MMDRMSEAIEEMFLHGKPARILVGIRRAREEKYASVLSREADCTYSHTVKLLNRFQDNGLVEFRQDGRKKIVELTEAGEQLAARMDELLTEIRDADVG